MKRLLVDANVVLEMLLQRSNSSKCYDIVNDDTLTLDISVLSVHLIYYFASKADIPLEITRIFIDLFGIAVMDNEVYQLATVINLEKDLEDALQISTSIIGEYDGFLTLDKGIETKYNALLPVMLL